MHSSRMRTARSLTISHCIYQWGVCMLHMPPCHAHLPPCMPPVTHAPPCHVCPLLPCMSPLLPCTFLLPRTPLCHACAPPRCEQTDTCKNITFACCFFLENIAFLSFYRKNFELLKSILLKRTKLLEITTDGFYPSV